MANINFVNLLPIRVNIYAYRINKLTLLGYLDPRSSTLKDNSGSFIKVKDEIHITFSLAKGGPEYEILEPVTIVEDCKNIRIGDVVHQEKTNTLTQRSHSDISGLRVHNKMTIPIRIYYQNNMIASLAGGDGTTFSSGSPGSVYINNDSKGFNIGDKLDLRLFISSKEIKWSVITISDNYMSDLYLGVINQAFNPPINDFYSYRFGENNVYGLKYISSD